MRMEFVELEVKKKGCKHESHALSPIWISALMLMGCVVRRVCSTVEARLRTMESEALGKDWATTCTPPLKDTFTVYFVLFNSASGILG